MQTVKDLVSGTMFHLGTDGHPLFKPSDVLMTTAYPVPCGVEDVYPAWEDDFIFCVCLTPGDAFGCMKTVWPDAPVDHIVSTFTIGAET